MEDGVTNTPEVSRISQDRPPIEDDIAHKLDQLQESFGREWLWFRGDPESASEQKAFQEAELAMQNVNIQFRRLNRLTKDQAGWTYRSHAYDQVILDYLSRRWPLDYSKESG